MTFQIKSIKETETIVITSIKEREFREKQTFNEIIRGYQALIKKLKDSKGKTDQLRASLISNLGSGVDFSGSNTEKLHQLNTELRETYKKLAESNESVASLKEKVAVLEKENQSLSDQNKKFADESDRTKTVISELIEKLEIRTKEHTALKKENELLNGKIKELTNDNALYFKKIMDLQNQMVEKMNDANQLYEEAKYMRKEGILSKHDETGISESGKNYGIDLSKLNENYFSVPSKTRHKLFAHAKEALCLAYSTQGTALATGGGDGTVRIWDVEQGKELGNLTKQKKAISALCFSPDDQFLVTCSIDRSIKVWKIQTLRESTTFSGHSDTINAVSFSYASKSLVTGSSDRTIRLWDQARGVAKKTFPCTSSCFALDNLVAESEIVSGHLDGSLKFWCSRNEEKIHEMKELHGDAVTSVKMTLDGHYVLTNSRDHTLKLIDIR
jgi:autophagy-related protein 16-1